MLNSATVKMLVIGLLISTPAFAERWVCYDPASVPVSNVITTRVEGDCLNLGLCSGTNNSGLDPNCFEAKGGEWNVADDAFKKVDPFAGEGSRIIDWTAQEITDLQNQQDINADLALRSSAKARFDGQQVDGQVLRCLGDIIRKEINILRQWTLDFKGEAAAATSLNNFKDRIATLPNLGPDGTQRTLAQLKTQMQQCIDDGDTDE